VKPALAAELVRRSYWRKGDAETRLRAVEARAKQRAFDKRVYAKDPEFELKVAKAAKQARKAMRA
jgi:hypothetical protein